MKITYQKHFMALPIASLMLATALLAQPVQADAPAQDVWLSEESALELTSEQSAEGVRRAASSDEEAGDAASGHTASDEETESAVEREAVKAKVADWTGWGTIEGKGRIYKTEEGNLTGFQEIGGELYLFGEDGILHQDNAWVHTERGWVFPNATGKIYRDQIITFGSQVAYYMDHDGTIATGFREVGDQLMYFNANGMRNHDNAWVDTERGKVFVNAKGLVYRDQMITFGPNVAFYMGHDGTIETGIHQVGNQLFNFRADGQRSQSEGWMETENGRVYVNAQGKVFQNQLITFGSRTAYYMGADGVPVTGMVEANGTVYRMTGKDGTLFVQAGPYSYKGKEYYADAKGYPFRDQILTIDGVDYYYGKDGAKVTSDFERNGMAYSLNRSTGAIASVKEKTPEAPRIYSLRDLQFQGVINWSGYKFTYYSQSVLPGPGLRIPGRHVNEAGYVADGDGYIVLANDAPKGTVIPTPFGYMGKVYDRGTVGNHFDVYTR